MNQDRHLIAITGGRLITPFDDISPGVVLVRGSRIVYAGSAAQVTVPQDAKVVDAEGLIVAPGFIDIHTHGAMGRLFSQVANALEMDEITRYLARTGTTSCFATIGSLGAMDEASLMSAVTTCASIAIEPETGGARVIGIHLEGPFLSPLRAGVSKAWERNAEHEPLVMHRLIAAGRGLVRIAVMAPELEEATEVIDICSKAGVRASIGHTDATYDRAMWAIARGANHATHTWNAMRPLHHREPGVVLATMLSPAVTSEVIADGVHVHPAAIRLLIKTKSRENVVLVTDGSGFGGLPDGEYRFAGGPRVLVQENKCSLEDGTIAGSVMPANLQLKVLVSQCGLSLSHAVQLMTANPALEFGFIEKGMLLPGKDADIVLFDTDFRVRRVYISGKPVYGGVM